ncbi:MAG: addiction module protein [Gemmataceae bacterium]
MNAPDLEPDERDSLSPAWIAELDRRVLAFKNGAVEPGLRCLRV